MVVIRPPRGGAVRHLDPIAMARGLWRHRALVASLTRQDVEQRYRGSFLGFAWSFVTPLLMLAVYVFVFSTVFQSRWGEGTPRTGEFALALFAGLLAFGVFSESVSRAPGTVLAMPSYVKKVVFPLEVLPVAAVGSAVVHSLVSAGILLLGSAVFLGALSPTALLLPLAYLPLVFLTLGVSWFLASLGVYVRDVGQAVLPVTQALFFLSPIFYPVTAVPEWLRPFLYANPFTVILSGFRRTLLESAPLDWGPWAVLTAATAAVALAGYAWFMQTKKGFADVM